MTEALERDSISRFIEHLFVVLYTIALYQVFTGSSIESFMVYIAFSGVLAMFELCYELVKTMCYDPELGF